MNISELFGTALDIQLMLENELYENKNNYHSYRVIFLANNIIYSLYSTCFYVLWTGIAYSTRDIDMLLYQKNLFYKITYSINYGITCDRHSVLSRMFNNYPAVKDRVQYLTNKILHTKKG